MSLLDCPICYTVDNIRKNNIEQEEETTKYFNFEKLLCCDSCGFKWAYPIPDKDMVQKYYTDIHRKNDGFNSNKKFIKPFKLKFYMRGVSQIELCRMFYDHDEEKDIKILDVGAGFGYTLDVASLLIPGINKFAVEPSIQMKKRLQESNITVYQKMFVPKESDYLKEKFDIIIISHVLEHFNGLEVFDTIQTLKSKLTKGGIIFCEVPNGDMDTRKNSPGKHQVFFSINSLRLLFENTGLEVLFVNSCGLLVTKENIRRYKEKRTKNPISIKSVVKSIPFLMSIYSKLNELADTPFFLNYPKIVRHPYFIYGGNNRQFLRIIGRNNNSIQ